MTPREARFILEACRPNGADEGDPRIAEAIRLLSSDRELRRWFQASQEFDRTIASKLTEVPVPEDLAQRIVVRKRAPALENPPWTRRRWLAAAASVGALGVASASLWNRSHVGKLDTFRSDMAIFMAEVWDRRFDLKDDRFAKLQDYLEGQPGMRSFDVPPELAGSRTLGCKTLRWEGHVTALVCFLPLVTQTVVHLLVVERKALTDPPGPKPQFVKLPTWQSAVWSAGDQVYLALTTASTERLTRCL